MEEALAQCWAKSIARDGLRFAVGPQDGRYSTVWKIWAAGDTIYIAGRKIGGSLKVSLHPIGGYRYAFTREFWNTLDPSRRPTPKRDVAVWPRPDLEPGQRALVASLFFPTDHLASQAQTGTRRRPLMHLQPARPGWTIEVAFVLSRDTSEEEDWEHVVAAGEQPLCRWQCDDGTAIVLTFHERPFDLTAVIPKTTPTIRRLSSPLDHSPERVPNLVGVLCNRPGAGVPLQIIELGGAAFGPNGPEYPSSAAR